MATTVTAFVGGFRSVIAGWKTWGRLIRELGKGDDRTKRELAPPLSSKYWRLAKERV